MANYWQFFIDGHAGGLLYYFLDISCMFEVFYWKRKTKLKIVNFQLPIFLVLTLSQIMQSNNLNNHSSLDFQFSLKFSTFLHPYKCSATSSTSKMNKLLAEVGSLMTSLVTLPQTVLSGPHNCLKTIISVYKLSNTLSPYSFCFIFLN